MGFLASGQGGLGCFLIVGEGNLFWPAETGKDGIAFGFVVVYDFGAVAQNIARLYEDGLMGKCLDTFNALLFFAPPRRVRPSFQ